jgi:monothiol glutaredoxin
MPDVDGTIRELVSRYKVVLFMKGSRHFPQCGFSAQVVEILNQLVPAYETVNVLADPEIREGIKRYSDWPTIPQLYVDGKFVGGCDIVKEMFGNGELAAALGAPAAGVSAAHEVASPAITVTARAAAAILAAREAPTDHLRLVVSPGFEHELFFDGPEPGDLVIDAGGVTLRVDPGSARRANGVGIDFIDASGGGFKVDNPNEPPRVRSMSPKALRAALDAREPLTIFDVRTDGERATARLSEALALDDAGQKRLAEMPKDSRLVFMCHHGMRSRVAAEAALRQGFTRVYNLDGGIDAWSTDVDGKVPRY